ncbi:MAG: alkaline phosphatase family protein [Pyrinomonadaceae bacterium]
MNVLGIGLDATEPRLVRKLIEAGQMPALEGLLKAGRWMRVESSAGIGSGAVWPSFISGEETSVHGVYGEWLWQPETMSVSRYRGRNLTPFWKKLAEGGMTVGILDVPFMPIIGLSDGFEISEWGAHDLLEGKIQMGPDRVASLMTKLSPHPLANYPTASGPDDYKELQKLGAACLEGIKQRGSLARHLLTEIRPQLALIAFTEIHHSAHYLWLTVEPEHPVYSRYKLADLKSRMCWRRRTCVVWLGD